MDTKVAAIMGLNGARCSSGISLVSHHTWNVRSPKPYPSSIDDSHMLCMRSPILSKSVSLRFVGFPLGSRLFQLSEGFQSQMQCGL